MHEFSQTKKSKPSFQRACELKDLLNKANHAYFVLDKPILEDAIYDRLYRELLDLEKNDNTLIAPDSPSQRLGGLPSKGFQTCNHKIPLFSLENVFNIQEFKNWYSKTIKAIEKIHKKNQSDKDLSMVAELKIDGNALALSYSNGLLVKAATRGDGNEGEEITGNVKTISSIPLSLNFKKPPPWAEIRGEAFMPNKIFDEINQKRKNNNMNIFANPRNACSGTLRQLDPKIVAERKLDFFAYTLHLPHNWRTDEEEVEKPKKQWDSLQWLLDAGFKVNPNRKRIEKLEELEHFLNFWETEKIKLDYATDGVVVKLNDLEMQNNLGFTQKAPKWAIAMKYPAEEMPTKLLRIIYQVGRTGAITPVAEFAPIFLAGSSISRATLHNANRLKELDIHEEDTIIVRKAGEIIPEVIKVIYNLRKKNANKVSLPKICPECSSPLNRQNNEAITRCMNKSCNAILRGSLRHWVSKSSMDIDGFGDKLIEQLVEKKLVKCITDLYRLKLETLANLERMGEKSATKLIEEINHSKSKNWHKQLYGLGIMHLGEANAKLIAKTFTSAKELSFIVKTSPKLIEKIHGIGPEIAESLKDWFNNPENENLLLNLKAIGFSLDSKIDDFATNNTTKVDHIKGVSGKVFVLTGTMISMKRETAKELIEKAGGKVNSTISTNTDFLVAGKKAGSKVKKAEVLEIKIINESEFKNLISS